MTIICATTEAAVQVLAVLIDARLTPGRDFRIAVSNRDLLFAPLGRLL
jgi:hypothetical protein